MQYRSFSKIDQKVSLLGMGTMRLPLNSSGGIDREYAIRLIREGIDAGINYVDTAYMYHDGESEVVTGEALKDGYREKVLLADKMPVWLAKDEEGMKELFYEQLSRLDTDCIDMYLIHNITAPVWKRAKKFNTLAFLEEMRSQGKIKYIGFSFHGNLPLFKEVIDSYDWDFCQIQLNYMDKNHQAGVEGLKYASGKGLGVIIMEPLKGGRLTYAVPPTIQKLWDSFPTKRTPAEWAFKWLCNMPQVTTILSGMGNREQLDSNLATFSQSHVEQLSDEEKALIDKVSDEYNRLIKYSCTGCNYCMPCPCKLDIPKILGYFNDWNVYEHTPSTKLEYTTWIEEGHHASDCIGCQECESKCPQGLPIAAAMKEAAEAFGI